MSAPPIRVAIMNDYEVVVRGVAAVLEPYADRVAVVEIAAGAQTHEAAEIALFDTFAQRDGFEEVRDNANATRLVVWSWDLQPERVRRALAAGAAGYLSKHLGGEELVAELLRIHEGEVVVSDPPDELVPVGDWPGRDDDLTPREAEVLALIAQGLSNQQVAERTFLSVNTVKTYIRAAYRKIGAESRSQAVLWALERGFEPDRFRSTRV